MYIHVIPAGSAKSCLLIPGSEENNES